MPSPSETVSTGYYRGFTNEKCEFFPCHKGVKKEFNCLFCYCPLVFLKCPGPYRVFTDKNGVVRKNCTDCTLPHDGLERSWKFVQLWLGKLTLAAAKAGLVTKTLEIETLKVQLARLRQQRFGRSSEKLDRQIAQLELVLEELEIAAGIEAPAAVETSPVETADPALVGDEPSPRRPGGRRPLPDHLPRREMVHMGGCACPACGGVLRQVGEDVTEILDYLPGRFEVIRHVRPDFSCRSCEGMQGAHAEPAHRARPAGAGPARPCAGGQVLRPSAAVPPIGHLCPRWNRTRPRHHDRLGRQDGGAAAAAGRGRGKPCDGGRQAACRRHPRPGVGAGHRQDQDQDRPIMGLFLDATSAKISGKSELAAAIRYARSRWTAFSRYIDDGRLEMSNNAAERAIRPLALGRKNWTFAGSDAGGERTAAIYTLVETAKLNGLDPEAYLRDIIGRVAAPPSTG